jgi:hypothetical protein
MAQVSRLRQRAGGGGAEGGGGGGGVPGGGEGALKLQRRAAELQLQRGGCGVAISLLCHRR